MKKDGYEIVADEVRKFWENNTGIPCEVICYFKHKYSFEKEWTEERVLAECNGSYDFENVTFIDDFNEGQTDYKDIQIYSLDGILDVFDKHKNEYIREEVEYV